MFYEKELNFLLSVMKKCRIKAKVIKSDELVPRVIEKSFSANGKKLEFIDNEGGILLPREKTMYKLDVGFGTSYIYFVLPETSGELLFIGPYLNEKFSEAEIMSFGEKNGFVPKDIESLLEYLCRHESSRLAHSTAFQHRRYHHLPLHVGTVQCS